jgi:thiol-disulfide isomerase/thioredoxin
MVLSPGDRAPALVAPDPSGKSQWIQFEHNRATLVNFWAPWCEPCRDEMPALQAVFDRRAGDGLAIIGVHLLGPPTEDMHVFLQSLGIRYPVLVGSVETAQKWFVDYLPTSYLIRADGTIARRYVGAKPGQVEAMVADIEAVLDGRPLGTLVLKKPTEPGP